MRKQTKLVAVVSAAALLAIGASMTSFAATGWVEEGGEWFFYDKDGTKTEDTWKKSGDKFFWLDSEESGAMALDKLFDDGDNTYYVDSTGAMVTNTWVKIVNEEQDETEDPAEYNYYYMQNTGKAYKAGDSGTTKFKTIDGKRYSFDADGKMLYGWVDGSGARMSGETDWATEAKDVYYCGNWDDGAMKTSWQKISVVEDDDNKDLFFFFNSNGKRFYNDGNDNLKKKPINGKNYGFDERGVMVYEWIQATDDATALTPSNWQYFNSPEDGARVTKGWFKVVAPNEDNSFKGTSDTFDEKNAGDESEKWYYADGKGNLKAGTLAKIKGKYYGFHPDGYMLNGLCEMSVDGNGKVTVVKDDMDADYLDTVMKKDGNNRGTTLYYFGNSEDSDGAMKTGATTVTLDGDTHNFLFSKSGGVESKGAGVSGIESNKYIYKFGKKLKASTDDKYVVVKASGDTASEDASVIEIKSSDLRGDADIAGKNKDGDTVKGIGTLTTDNYLINTSGTIVKSKTAALDGDDWYFYVNDKQIKMYLNNKTITAGKDATIMDLTKWKIEEIVLGE